MKTFFDFPNGSWEGEIRAQSIRPRKLSKA
jgi:hypothetical protein